MTGLLKFISDYFQQPFKTTKPVTANIFENYGYQILPPAQNVVIESDPTTMVMKLISLSESKSVGRSVVFC